MNELNPKELTKRFREDIDKVCLELIKAYSLKFMQEVPTLSSPLTRWLDFRYRYIEPRPRQIILSDKFPKINISNSAKQAFKKIQRAIRFGRDINPYQGRGLILRNDSSGAKPEARTDLLWASWGIQHLHLSNAPIPEDQYFSRAADYLAFCLVDDIKVVFIDILKHPDITGFSDPRLIQIIHQNWPDYMNQFKLNGISGGKELNQSDIHQLRTAGINSQLVIGNDVYFEPGLGITSARTPMKTSMAEMHIMRALEALAKEVCDPHGQFHTSRITANTQCDFSIVPTPRGLAVFESTSNTAFLLPKSSRAGVWDVYAELQNLILPDWALAHYKNLSNIDR